VPDAPPEPQPAPEPLPEWVAAVQAAVPDGVLSALGVPGGTGPADLPTLEVAPPRWFEVVAALKAGGCDMFVDLGGVDHPEREARFEIVLHLRDLAAGRLVRCRTRVPEGAALPSLEPIFPAAGWPERELFDLLGVRFDGNGDLRRLLLPDDWEGHPLRRDYPLAGPRVLDPESPYAH
jgi:NADH-quinone oxidoreductase subunit C